MEINELDAYISSKIQGVFGKGEMQVLKSEIEKLKPGDIYVEIGTDEGRSARVAHEYANEGVYKLWIDINDPDLVPGITVGRGKFMQNEGMVGLGKKGFWVHGDADEFLDFLTLILHAKLEPIKLIFIDGFHDYESVKKNTLQWEQYLEESSRIAIRDGDGKNIGIKDYIGSVLLFHDYDHPGVKKWLDEHYGDKKEVFGGKIVKVQL